MVYGTHTTYRDAHGGDDMAAYKTFRDLDLVVRQSYRTLAPRKSEFDAIIVTGVSGLSVGAPLALRLKKRLLVLRKEDENCHDQPGNLVGSADLDTHQRVLFVDDLISSGATLRKCRQAVEQYAKVFGEPIRIVMAYTYEGDRLLDDADDIACSW